MFWTAVWQILNHTNMWIQQNSLLPQHHPIIFFSLPSSPHCISSYLICTKPFQSHFCLVILVQSVQLHSQWFSDNYLVWSDVWWLTDHSWQWFIMFFYCPVDVISLYYMWNHDSLPAPFEQHVLCVHGKYEHVYQTLWCLWNPFSFRRGGHWHERCATPDAELCLSWRREAQSERMQPKEGEGILWLS